MPGVAFPPTLPKSPEARESPNARGRLAIDIGTTTDMDAFPPGFSQGVLNGENGDEAQRTQTPRARRKSIGGGLHKKGSASIPGEPKGQRWEDIVKQIFKLLDRKGVGTVSGWELSQMMGAMESDKVGDLAMRASGRRGARDVPLRLEDMRIVLDAYGCSRLEDLLWFVEGVMRVEQGMASKWTAAIKAWHAVVSRLHAAGMHMIGCHLQTPEVEKWLMTRLPATKAHRHEFVLAASRKIPASKRGDALAANDAPAKHGGESSSMGLGGANSASLAGAAEGSVDFNAVKDLLRSMPHHEIAKSLSYLLPVDVAREHRERLWAAFERAQTLQQQLAWPKRRRPPSERGDRPADRRCPDGNDAPDGVAMGYAGLSNSHASSSGGAGGGVTAGGGASGNIGAGASSSLPGRTAVRRTTAGDAPLAGGEPGGPRRADPTLLDRKLALVSARSELQVVLAMIHKGLRPVPSGRPALGASQLWSVEEYDSEAAVVVRGADGLAGVEPRGGPLRQLYGAALVKAGALAALVEMIDLSMPIRNAATRHEAEESAWFGGRGGSCAQEPQGGPRADSSSNGVSALPQESGGHGDDGSVASPSSGASAGEEQGAADGGNDPGGGAGSPRRPSRELRRSRDEWGGASITLRTSTEIAVLDDPPALEGGHGSTVVAACVPRERSPEVSPTKAAGAAAVSSQPQPAEHPADPTCRVEGWVGKGERGGGGGGQAHAGPAALTAVGCNERLRISEVVQAIIDLSLQDAVPACMAPAKRRVEEFLELQPVELETRTASDWLNLLLTAPDDVERCRALEQLNAWERRRLQRSSASWRRRSRVALALAWGIAPPAAGGEGGGADDEGSTGAPPAVTAAVSHAARGSLAHQQAVAEAAAAAAAAAVAAVSPGLKPSPLSSSSAVALVLARLNLATHASLHEHRGPIRKLLVTFLVSLLQGMGDVGRIAFAEANGTEILCRLLFGPCGWRRRHLPIGREDEELDDFVLANVPLFPAHQLRDGGSSITLNGGGAPDRPISATSPRRPKSGSGYGKNSAASRIQTPPAVALVPWGVDWHYERDFADDGVYGARDRGAVVAALVCLVCEGGVWGPKRGGDTLLRCPLILPALALHACTPMSLFHALLAHALAHENLKVLQDAAALSFTRGLSFVLEGAAPCLGLALPPTLFPSELAGDWSLRLARALSAPIGRSKLLELVATLKSRADAAVLASLRAALRPESLFSSTPAATTALPQQPAGTAAAPSVPSRGGSSTDVASPGTLAFDRGGTGCPHHALAREGLRPPLHLLQDLDPDVSRLVICVAWQPRLDAPCACGHHHLQKYDRSGGQGQSRQGSMSGVGAGASSPCQQRLSPPFPGDSHNTSSNNSSSHNTGSGSSRVLGPASPPCLLQAVNVAEWDAAGRVLSLCAAGLLHANRQLAEQMLALVTDALLAFRVRFGAVQAATRRRHAAQALQRAMEAAAAFEAMETRVGSGATGASMMMVDEATAATLTSDAGCEGDPGQSPPPDGATSDGPLMPLGAIESQRHGFGATCEQCPDIAFSPLTRFAVAFPPDFRAPTGDACGPEPPPVAASCNLGLALGGELSPGPQGAVALVTAGRLLQLAAWNLGLPAVTAVVAARAISLQGGAFVPDVHQPWGESFYVLAPSYGDAPTPLATTGASGANNISAVPGGAGASAGTYARAGLAPFPAKPAGHPLDMAAQEPPASAAAGQQGFVMAVPPASPLQPSSLAERRAVAVLAALKVQPGQGPLPGALDTHQVSLRGGVSMFRLPAPLPVPVADAYGLVQVCVIRSGTYYPRQSMLERYPQGDLAALVTSLDRIIRALKACASDGSTAITTNNNNNTGINNSNNNSNSSGSSNSSGGGGSMQEQHAMLELAAHLVFELSFTEGEELYWEGGPTGLLDRLGICTDDFRLLLPAVLAGSLETLTGPAGLLGARGLLRPDRKERFGRQEVGFLRVGSRWHLWLNGTGGKWWLRQQAMQQLLQQHLRRPHHRRMAKPQASAPPAPGTRQMVAGASEQGGSAPVTGPGPYTVAMESPEGDDEGEDEEESVQVQEDGWKPHRVPLQPITCGKAFYGYLGIENAPKFSS